MTLHELMKEVCAKYGTSLYEVKGRHRNRNIVDARREICYRGMTELKLSSGRIGRTLGRDHTTVLHHKWRIDRPDVYRTKKAAADARRYAQGKNGAVLEGRAGGPVVSGHSMGGH